jgi:hypothetical protein
MQCSERTRRSPSLGPAPCQRIDHYSRTCGGKEVSSPLFKQQRIIGTSGKRKLNKRRDLGGAGSIVHVRRLHMEAVRTDLDE